ncbi:MAG: 30S ribosomal protein S9 [Candidatus Levybacteria bacterium]|nr:30S ribosomal protein S9 [Candidatus Levybacteria bacterium]
MAVKKVVPEEQKAVKRTKNSDFVFAVGRRKASIARVRLYTTVKEGLMWGTTPIKKGDVLVNEKPISEFFPDEVDRYIYSEPLRVVNAQNKHTITIRVTGGGTAGQLGAVVQGIANVLSKHDTKEYRTTLKKKGFLTRDARVRERRKVGTGGKARRAKQSPKR